MFHFWALGLIGLEFFLTRCLSRSLNVYRQTVSNPDSNSIQLGEAINELSSDQDAPLLHQGSSFYIIHNTV